MSRLILVLVLAVLAYLCAVEVAFRMLGGDPYAEPFGHRVG